MVRGKVPDALKVMIRLANVAVPIYGLVVAPPVMVAIWPGLYPRTRVMLFE